VTRGQLPQRAGSLGLNGGGATAAVTPSVLKTRWISKYHFHVHMSDPEASKVYSTVYNL